MIFGIESSDRKVILLRLVGFVCERNAHAMAAVDSGSGGSKSTSQNDITTSALMILSEINQKYPREMKQNGLQILVSAILRKKIFFCFLNTSLNDFVSFSAFN